VYVRSFYPALNAHAPHCNLRPARLYSIHHHHLINSKNSEKKAIEHEMYVLICYTNLYETFLILRRTERDMIKVYTGLHVKYRLFLSEFTET